MTYRLFGAISVCLAAGALLTPARAATDEDMSRVLKKIEKRYNSAKSLEAAFTQVYTSQGRKRTESGVLYLRKPGRMRWDYRNPAGKLFITDGKQAYFYDPDTNRAEKLKLKETEDLRAPMAFLLGRLDFDKDFRAFQSKPEGSNLWVTASPKSDNVPYRQVQFLVAPDSRIERLIVTGQDASVLDFAFDNEKRNPPVSDAMFQFHLPPGAQFVDSSETAGGDR